jgi:hypothetical protein
MAGSHSTLGRRATSEILFRRLSAGIADWRRKRLEADTRGQHTTQLTAIDSVLRKILDQLEEDRNALDAVTDAGTFYDRCERFDRRTIWLERLWRFFRVRLDQRDDEDCAGVLQAADEVVWSCYSRPIQKATALGLRSGPAPAPVPFIEAQYAPEAFPTELVPPDLKNESEATSLLRDHLNKMPIPIVRMTPSCVAAPWLVVYLAHEVGHHVQYDLLPQRKLVMDYRRAIEAGVEAETGSAEEARKWGGWSQEIFADMFSVMAMGPWAVGAMVELEFGSPGHLDEERDAYPSAAMRLALLAEACDRVTGTSTGTLALRNLVQPVDSAVRRAVLDVALGVLPGTGQTLQYFCGLDMSGFARRVALWETALAENADQEPQPHVENALVLTGAALATWEKAAAQTPPDLLVAVCRDLGTRYIGKVAAGAPEGERAGAEGADVNGLAQDMLDRIWQETA